MRISRILLLGVARRCALPGMAAGAERKACLAPEEC